MASSTVSTHLFADYTDSLTLVVLPPPSLSISPPLALVPSKLANGRVTPTATLARAHVSATQHADSSYGVERPLLATQHPWTRLSGMKAVTKDVLLFCAE